MDELNILAYAKVPHHLFQIAFLEDQTATSGNKILFIDQELFSNHSGPISGFFNDWRILTVRSRPTYFDILIGNIFSFCNVFLRKKDVRLYVPLQNLPLNMIRKRGSNYSITVLEDGRNTYRNAKENKIFYPELYRRILPYFLTIYDANVDEFIADKRRNVYNLKPCQRIIDFNFEKLFHRQQILNRLIENRVFLENVDSKKTFVICGLFHDIGSLLEQVKVHEKEDRELVLKLHPRQKNTNLLDSRYHVEKTLTPAEYLIKKVDPKNIIILGETTVEESL